MKQSRGSLYLVTGLFLGLVLGLLFAWMVQPVQVKDASPDSLQLLQKDQFRELTALAFVSNGDLVRAKARLALLEDKDAQQSLIDQIKRMAGQGETGEVTALRLLLAALQQNP